MSFTLLRSLLVLGLVGFGPALSSAQEITGKAVYKYCKACHGERGEGGQDGKYPRIAGLPQDYLDRQLHEFKNQTRLNKPMIPIFKHVRFDAKVIETVAGYVAGMSTPDLGLWPYQAPAAALAGFDSKAAFAEAGKQAYEKDCASCHGDQGLGGADAGAPPLTQQYPAYLIKQMGDFAAGERSAEHTEACGSPPPAIREAIVNHLVELGNR